MAARAQRVSATESEKPADLSTSAPPKREPDARRKAAFNGGQVRPVRPVTLAKGGGAQDADASLRAIRAGAAKRAPKTVRLGGGESAIGMPISEQDQRVGVVANHSEMPGSSVATIISEPTIEAAEINAPFGGYRLADLRAGQCRFACTGFSVGPEQHRFCGAPVAWLRGKPTSWCADHLLAVSAAPGASAGGRSLVDVQHGDQG